jgi:hypothetical protein
MDGRKNCFQDLSLFFLPTLPSRMSHRKRPAADEIDGARVQQHGGGRTPAQVEETFQRSIKKALEERLCVIQANHSEDDDAARRRTFAMLGSTGNVYHVTISCDDVSCNCPHGIRGATCKHLIYVFVRKLKLSRNSPLIRRKTLTDAEWDRLFAADLAAVENLVDADEKTRRAYELLQAGKSTKDIDTELAVAASAAAATAASEPKTDATLDADSECPICCCEIEPDEGTVWCRGQCGGNLHTKCFDTWQKHVGAAKTTCPYCRIPWWEPALPAAANDKKVSRLVVTQDEGYQNLAWRNSKR